MLKYDLNLREYWRILKRRKFIIIFTVIIMGLFSFMSAILGKPVPVFKTTSTVKVEKSVSYVGMNAVQALTGASNAMETQTYVIKSYYILELTARKMGLIPTDLPHEEVRLNNKYINIISELQSKVFAEQLGNSELIEITVSANEPKFATNLCNTLTETYKTQHNLDLNRKTLEGKKFIEGQFVISRNKLAKSEDIVKRFRENNRWTSLESESKYLGDQLNRLQALYDQEQIVYQKINAAASALSSAEYTTISAKKSFYFDEAYPPYKALNDRLVNLMMDRDTLLLTYTEEFPQIQAIKSQIHEIIASMKSHLKAQQGNLASNLRIYRQQMADLNNKFKKLPEKALELTRLERDVDVAKEVNTLLEKKYQEALIAEAEKLEEVKILKPAIEPTAPINPPKIVNNTILGILLGIILGIVFALVIETFDTSIGAIEEVEEFLGIHVLGVIPFVSMEEIKTLISNDPKAVIDEDELRRYARLSAHFVPASTLSESYKALRTSLNFSCAENKLKTILFTSSSPGEGKTSIVINLAITMAQIGQKVLLIDGDLRRPIISKLFGIEQIPGLTDIILGNYEWHKVVRSITDLMTGKLSIEDIMKTPGLDNLHIITSGSYSPNPAEILDSRAIGEFLDDIRGEYDIILIDAPPVLAATDAALWSSRTDGTAMVYQVGKVARGALKRSKVSLENLKANLIGVVLNGLKAEISPDFGYQSYYHYQYKNEDTSSPSNGNIIKNIIKKTNDILALFRRTFERNNKKRIDREDTSNKSLEGNKLSQTTLLKPDNTGKTGSGSFKNRLKDKSTLWIKILLVFLLILLLGGGILYEAGYLKAERISNDFRRSSSAIEIIHTIPQEETINSNKVEPKPTAHVKTEPNEFAYPNETKPFSIQVMAVRTLEEAQRYVDELKKEGEDAFTTHLIIKDQGLWNRIFIGHFKTKEEALAYIKERRIDIKFNGSIVRNAANP